MGRLLGFADGLGAVGWTVGDIVKIGAFVGFPEGLEDRIGRGLTGLMDAKLGGS